jgi:phage terminase large subunit
VSAHEDLVALLAETADDPGAHARLVLGVELYAWQQDVCSDVAARLARGERLIKILVRAAHGSGKSYLAACLLLWFMSTRPGSRGITTAAKWAQVLDVLWPEVRALYDKSLLGRLSFGRCLTDRIEFSPVWFATGASSDMPQTLEGQHSLVGACRFIDEAKSVPDSTYTSTDGLLASAEVLDVWTSTAGTTQGKFYRRDVIDTDDVIRRRIDIDQCIREGIIGAEAWKAERLKDWGANSIEFRSRAMCDYVSDAEDVVYPSAWIERAMSPGFNVSGVPVGGLDPAGSTAGDASALALVAGPDTDGRFECRSVTSWHAPDTQESKGRALLILRDAGAVTLACDVIGLGKGLSDSLRQDFPGVVEFRASDRAVQADRFANAKAEQSWQLRSLLETGKIALPKNEALRREMLAERYQVTPAGKIKVIDGADSPDHLDALLIALSIAAGGRSFTLADVSGDGGRGDYWASPPAWNAPSQERQWE